VFRFHRIAESCCWKPSRSLCPGRKHCLSPKDQEQCDRSPRDLQVPASPANCGSASAECLPSILRKPVCHTSTSFPVKSVSTAELLTYKSSETGPVTSVFCVNAGEVNTTSPRAPPVAGPRTNPVGSAPQQRVRNRGHASFGSYTYGRFLFSRSAALSVPPLQAVPGLVDRRLITGRLCAPQRIVFFAHSSVPMTKILTGFSWPTPFAIPFRRLSYQRTSLHRDRTATYLQNQPRPLSCHSITGMAPT